MKRSLCQRREDRAAAFHGHRIATNNQSELACAGVRRRPERWRMNQIDTALFCQSLRQLGCRRRIRRPHVDDRGTGREATGKPFPAISTSRNASADGRTVMITSQPCAIIFGEPLIMPPTSLVNTCTATSTTS